MADTEYLKKAVGGVLAKGVAETCNARPEDPIEFLAQYLLKSVADGIAETELTAQKADAEKVKAAEEVEADKAASQVTEKQEALDLTHDKEDKRLDMLLSSAQSVENVFSVVLAYARARTGANGYVMLTDLPEKLLAPTPPEPAPACEPEEGAPAAEDAPPPEEPPPPAEGEGEEAEPPPKYKPQLLEYVCSTAPDEALVVGKKLARPPAPPEEDDGTPPPPSGVGEGVTFTAIDDFLSGGPKVFHEPRAVQNRSIKFWYLPRMGSYAAAPFDDVEGEVKGVLGFDTLGLERAFSAAELTLLEELSVRTSTELKRIEQTLADEFHPLNDALKAMLPAEPPAAPEEGADPFEVATAALTLPKEMLALCTAAHLKWIETRRTCPVGTLLTFKAVLALLADEMLADELLGATFDDIKSGFSQGELPWGDDLFSQITAFDVMAGVGSPAGWEACEKLVTELATVPEDGSADVAPKEGILAYSAVGHALYSWVAGTVELHKLKVAKDAAEAEAAAAAAAAEEEAADVGVPTAAMS
uniref:RIIa domain-containing protein n=1 Tax=Haptolina brevifila TaxID=156173 RepID=A0A7S2CEQ8_9EUKA